MSKTQWSYTECVNSTLHTSRDSIPMPFCLRCWLRSRFLPLLRWGWKIIPPLLAALNFCMQSCRLHPPLLGWFFFSIVDAFWYCLKSCQKLMEPGLLHRYPEALFEDQTIQPRGRILYRVHTSVDIQQKDSLVPWGFPVRLSRWSSSRKSSLEKTFLLWANHITFARV